jgi:hypothetical protein
LHLKIVLVFPQRSVNDVLIVFLHKIMSIINLLYSLCVHFFQSVLNIHQLNLISFETSLMVQILTFWTSYFNDGVCPKSQIWLMNVYFIPFSEMFQLYNIIMTTGFHDRIRWCVSSSFSYRVATRSCQFYGPKKIFRLYYSDLYLYKTACKWSITIYSWSTDWLWIHYYLWYTNFCGFRG